MTYTCKHGNWASNTAIANVLLVKLFPKAQAVWTQQPHLSQSIQNIWAAFTPSGTRLSHISHWVSSTESDSSLSMQNRAGSCRVRLGLQLGPGCIQASPSESVESSSSLWCLLVFSWEPAHFRFCGLDVCFSCLFLSAFCPSFSASCCAFSGFCFFPFPFLLSAFCLSFSTFCCSFSAFFCSLSLSLFLLSLLFPFLLQLSCFLFLKIFLFHHLEILICSQYSRSSYPSLLGCCCFLRG